MEPIPSRFDFLEPVVAKKVSDWLEGCYDDETKTEIEYLLTHDPVALNDAFFKDLTFGTGGMRGLMGVGTNRMNRYTIQKATQGLAQVLLQQKKGGPVFIGYDVRYNSSLFAIEAARVLAGSGIEVLIAEEICPTPLVSFACRHFHCKAAIMITASHNPPQYNGYKVYGEDGAQVVPPLDQQIIEEVEKVQSVKLAPPDSPLIRRIGKTLDKAYLHELKKLQIDPIAADLHIVYSNLHGTGIRILQAALQTWGYSQVTLVEKQTSLDGNFPFAPSPNPEEEQALRLGTEQLLKTKGDLFLATDPDADRLGVVIRHEKKAIRLSGNQIGCLCLNYICQHSKLPLHPAFVKTIVTTELFKAIAESAGGICVDVLTGFKYIAEQIRLWENTSTHFVFGAEESYGYLYGTFVRDKDGISSSCLIAEAAAHAKKEGLTLLDVLHQLYQTHGVHRECLHSLTFADSQEGMSQMQTFMTRLRMAPPSHIAQEKVVKVEDYLKNTPLPKSDVLRFWLEDGSKVVIRPSGTEPKVKIYAEVVSKETKNLEKTIQYCDVKLHQIIENTSFGEHFQASE